MKPGQVQKAAQDAEALIQQYAATPEPAPEQVGEPQPIEAKESAEFSPPDPSPQPEAELEPVVAAEPAQLPVPKSLETQPEQPKPAPVNNQAFEPAKATKQELLEAFLQLEQRHRSLQGTYQAQVPRKEQDLRAAQTQVSTLEQRVIELTSELDAAKAAKPASAEQPATDLSTPFAQKMVEDWGEEAAREILAEMSTEQTRQPATEPVAQSQSQPPAQQPAPVQEQPQQQANGEDDLRIIVENIVGPGAFAAFDKDPEFQEWLSQPDMREGGKTRKEALGLAFRGGDLYRAAGFWIDWNQIKYQGTRAPQVPAGDPREAHLDAPATQSNADTGYEEQPGTVLASEINTFYSDITKGYYRGREAEKKAMEQKFNAAMQSGNVIDDVRQVSSA